MTEIPGHTDKYKHKDGRISGHTTKHNQRDNGAMAGHYSKHKLKDGDRIQAHASKPKLNGDGGGGSGKDRKGSGKPEIKAFRMKCSDSAKASQPKSVMANFQDLLKLAAKNSLSSKSSPLGGVADSKERNQSPNRAHSPVGKSLLAGRHGRTMQESRHGKTSIQESGCGRTVQENGHGKAVQESGRGKAVQESGRGKAVQESGVQGKQNAVEKKTAQSATFAALNKNLPLARQPLRSTSSPKPLTGRGKWSYVCLNPYLV